jgi:hypothetical protein
MSMFVIEKSIKSSEEKVVFSVMYCSLSDFVSFTFEVSLLSTPLHVRLRSLNFRCKNVQNYLFHCVLEFFFFIRLVGC